MKPENAAPALNGVFLSSYDPLRSVAPAPVPAAAAPDRRRVLQAALPEPPRPELVLDESNLLPFHFLRTGDRMGRAVVKIERADGAAGTGFLVAPGILLTNHHVLPDAATAADAHALANFEEEPPADPAGRPLSVGLRPSALFVTNSELDFTFCGVHGLDHLGCVPLRRESLGILPSEYVNIIQHPRGRAKQVALQDSRVVRVDSVVVQYCCDTEPGSSGSPVFNNLWRLVALHHASVETDAPGGRRVFGAPAASRYLNEGIRLSAIALWLESAEADTPEMRPHVQRIRQVFADLDGQVGYFGALGRRAGPRSAAELVVDAYGPQTDALDLAYWNLHGQADAVGENLAALGRVIVEMGLDVWCLAGLKPRQLRVLAEHLDAHHHLSHRSIVHARSGLALLVRRRQGRSAAWLPGPEPRAVLRDAAGESLLVPVPRDAAARPTLERDGDEPSEVILIGDGIGPRGLRRLAAAGSAWLAATGTDGGLVIAPDPARPPAAIFVSPNLDRTFGLVETLTVAVDRRWPAALAALSVLPPLVARVVRGGARRRAARKRRERG